VRPSAGPTAFDLASRAGSSIAAVAERDHGADTGHRRQAATQNNLSDERTEFYLRDRLTWMRFLGLSLGDFGDRRQHHLDLPRGPDQRRRDPRLFELFDQELRAAGSLAMAGQLVHASIIAAPKQRNTRAETQAAVCPRAGKPSRRRSNLASWPLSSRKTRGLSSPVLRLISFTSWPRW
jgi:hypothetical protein